MSKGDFADGDAMAAAMAKLHAESVERLAREDLARQKKAERRVMMPAGDLAAILFALEDAAAFAHRQSNTKEYRVRTDAVNIVARNKPLIEKLRKKIPEYVPDQRERGQGT